MLRQVPSLLIVPLPLNPSQSLALRYHSSQVPTVLKYQYRIEVKVRTARPASSLDELTNLDAVTEHPPRWKLENKVTTSGQPHLSGLGTKGPQMRDLEIGLITTLKTPAPPTVTSAEYTTSAVEAAREILSSPWAQNVRQQFNTLFADISGGSARGRRQGQIEIQEVSKECSPLTGPTQRESLTGPHGLIPLPPRLKFLGSGRKDRHPKPKDHTPYSSGSKDRGPKTQNLAENLLGKPCQQSLGPNSEHGQGAPDGDHAGNQPRAAASGEKPVAGSRSKGITTSIGSKEPGTAALGSDRPGASEHRRKIAQLFATLAGHTALAPAPVPADEALAVLASPPCQQEGHNAPPDAHREQVSSVKDGAGGPEWAEAECRGPVGGPPSRCRPTSAVQTGSVRPRAMPAAAHPPAVPGASGTSMDCREHGAKPGMEAETQLLPHRDSAGVSSSLGQGMAAPLPSLPPQNGASSPPRLRESLTTLPARDLAVSVRDSAGTAAPQDPSPKQTMPVTREGVPAYQRQPAGSASGGRAGNGILDIPGLQDRLARLLLDLGDDTAGNEGSPGLPSSVMEGSKACGSAGKKQRPGGADRGMSDAAPQMERAVNFTAAIANAGKGAAQKGSAGIGAAAGAGNVALQTLSGGGAASNVAVQTHFGGGGDAPRASSAADAPPPVGSVGKGPHAGAAPPVGPVGVEKRKRLTQKGLASKNAAALHRRVKMPRSAKGMGHLQPLVVAGQDAGTELEKGTFQLSRSGRVRVPPLAYWANQSIRIDHKAGRAFAIDTGFPDQLAADSRGLRKKQGTGSRANPVGRGSLSKGFKGGLRNCKGRDLGESRVLAQLAKCPAYSRIPCGDPWEATDVGPPGNPMLSPANSRSPSAEPPLASVVSSGAQQGEDPQAKTRRDRVARGRGGGDAVAAPPANTGGRAAQRGAESDHPQVCPSPVGNEVLAEKGVNPSKGRSSPGCLKEAVQGQKRKRGDVGRPAEKSVSRVGLVGSQEMARQLRQGGKKRGLHQGDLPSVEPPSASPVMVGIGALDTAQEATATSRVPVAKTEQWHHHLERSLGDEGAPASDVARDQTTQRSFRRPSGKAAAGVVPREHGKRGLQGKPKAAPAAKALQRPRDGPDAGRGDADAADGHQRPRKRPKQGRIRGSSGMPTAALGVGEELTKQVPQQEVGRAPQPKHHTQACGPERAASKVERVDSGPNLETHKAKPQRGKGSTGSKFAYESGSEVSGDSGKVAGPGLDERLRHKGPVTWSETGFGSGSREGGYSQRRNAPSKPPPKKRIKSGRDAGGSASAGIEPGDAAALACDGNASTMPARASRSRAARNGLEEVAHPAGRPGPSSGDMAEDGEAQELGGAAGEAGSDSWTQQQVTALQAAYLVEEDPTRPGFWMRVAKRVPGKSASECFAKIFSSHPTPAADAKPPKPRRYVVGARPSPSKNAGHARKPTSMAQRKQARQVAWQKRAEALVVGEGQAEASGAAAHLLQAAARQEQTDKYIDAFFARHGQPQQWASRKKTDSKPTSVPHPAAAGGSSLLRPSNLAAALNLLRQERSPRPAYVSSPESSEVDADYYWEDAE
eukprot:jgi/Botrbrau1/7691/Bobra.0159s0129.1